MRRFKPGIASIPLYIFIGFLTPVATPSAYSAPIASNAQFACKSTESWHFSKEISSPTSSQFSALLRGKSNAMKSFVQALSLRRNSTSAEPRIFSEYWISRSLYEIGNIHSAVLGFLYLASEYPDSTTIGIQIAAFDCLNVIRSNYPGLFSGVTLIPRIQKLLELTDDPKHLNVLWRFSGGLVRELIGTKSEQTKSALSLLDGAGARESFASGLYAASTNDYNGTIDNFQRFFNQPVQDEEITRLTNQAHLLIARAFYTKKRFPEALNELKKIEKNSNELIEGLSELSWAQLQAERYPEAIGTALSLQSGGLRRTFAPEALMVMAMALNEICQYPESLRATEAFRKAYETSFQWLSNREVGGGKSDLYTVVVDYLKKRKSTVPERVLSELLRSPVFIASQEELNLIARERSAIAQMSRMAAKDQKQMGKLIQTESRLLLVKLRDLKQRKQSPLPIQKELSDFREKVKEYRNFRRAAADWRNIVQNFESRSSLATNALLSKIHNDLGRRSARMLRVLEEVAENNELIEAEIYHGASKDIIWQNAHPDYKEVMALAAADKAGGRSKVWEWGRGSPLDDRWSEIWEDEIGSFKATLLNNCSSKERYLAIKRDIPLKIKQAQVKRGEST